MGRVSITEENRTGQGGDRFPQMKLVTGEKSRFFMFEEPWSEWIHELRAPVIEGGVAVMEVRHKKDKSTYEVVKQQFLRRSICHGDPAVMKEKGIDEANCPACKAFLDSGGDVPKPVQRFAAACVRYKLQGSGWNIQDPFSAEILIWSITARMWDSIIELQNKIGDLRKHDLTLDCEDGDWQRNKLSFEMDAAYLASQENLIYVKKLLAGPGNRPTDEQLRDACGSVATRSYLEQDVSLILTRWRQANNSGNGGSGTLPAAVTPTPMDLGAGIDDLLGTSAPPSAQPAQSAFDLAQASAGLDPNDPLAMFGASAPGTPVTSQAQPSAQTATAVAQSPTPGAAPAAAASVPAVSASGDLSFEELLGL